MLNALSMRPLVPPKTIPISERLRRNSRADDKGCWVWTGGLSHNGYGQIFIDHKSRRAHRVSYELARGAVPPGLQLDHLCRNRACINPAHLEPVTQRENIRRGLGPQIAGSRWRSKTKCPHGHAYEGENLIVTAAGHRKCRACQKVANAARYKKPLEGVVL
jgi:hypothetical protein